MPTPYTPASSFHATILLPADGEPANAASVQGALRDLGDNAKSAHDAAAASARTDTPNTFSTGPQTIHGDLEATNLHGSGDVNVTDVHARGNVILDTTTGDFLYATGTPPVITPRPRLTIIPLRTGILRGVSPGLALEFEFVFGNASCSSWGTYQRVEWPVRLPSGAKLKYVQIIHETSAAAAPNRFDLLKRTGATFDFYGGGTVSPSTPSSLLPVVSLPSPHTYVSGPDVVTPAFTTLLSPAAPVLIDNSFTEYFVSWVSSGAHANDNVKQIQVAWDDAGPRND